MCGQRGRETRVEICVFLSKFLIGDSLPGVPNAPSCSVPLQLLPGDEHS